MIQSTVSGSRLCKYQRAEESTSSFPLASSVGVSSNSLPPSPVLSKSSTRISTPGRRCSLPASKNLQSPVSDESTPPPFSQKSFGRKKERNTWTRKLSSVTDEKEQSEEEIEPSSFDSRRLEDPPGISQEQFMLRAFLQQVEQKNHEFCDHLDNQFDGLTDLPDETDSADDNSKNIQYRILHYIQNSAVGSFLYTPVIHELWQQNSTSTLARYFCSTVLAFIALCCLFSLILPCMGINFNIRFGKDIYDSIIMFCYSHHTAM
ncbi:uncharacterized protein NPIL_2051 [Nephila pilipes]|uniref:Uncharacterized protein n=1 Tax=Nephila pilipes TaxID=299642 RepID=A0A8X6PJN6_NEPPI|nr:uncharacterized protein NPIL_2051 [Nephila pilipes]